MHKNIDDAMRCAEFYSPLGFLRLLLKVDRINKYRVIQMQPHHFKDYASCAKMLKYSNIPYTKVSQLRFNQNDKFTLQYKLSHKELTFISSFVGTERNSRNTMSRNGRATPTERIILAPQIQKRDKDLSKEKVKDIQSMLQFMPLVDREYYKTVNIQ